MTQQLQEQQTDTEDKQLLILNYMMKDIQRDLRKRRILTTHEWSVFWFVFVRLLRFPNPQSLTVTENESVLMRGLYARGFSMGDLAFIFDRSKSTIHETLKKFEQ